MSTWKKSNVNMQHIFLMDAVKTKSCGLRGTAQKRPKKEQNPNQQLAKPNTIASS
jgi:hypothetical protein